LVPEAVEDLQLDSKRKDSKKKWKRIGSIFFKTSEANAMLKPFSFMIMLMSVCALGNCIEGEGNRQTLSRLTTLAVVLEGHDASGLDLSQQRIYLDPQKIAVTNEGLITYAANQKTVILPELFSASEGYFVRCSEKDLEILSKDDELRMWWCSVCRGIRNMDKSGRCTTCGHKV
jgi:hypothetical protein